VVKSMLALPITATRGRFAIISKSQISHHRVTEMQKEKWLLCVSVTRW
jgi:hypothetical protein